MKLALVNERGQIKARRKFVTKDVKGHAGWLERVAAEVADLQAKEGAGKAIAGIGVGVPGFGSPVPASKRSHGKKRVDTDLSRCPPSYVNHPGPRCPGGNSLL